MNLSPTEKQRVRHINFLMDDFHFQLSDVYESLIDREFDVCKTKVEILISKLNQLSESLTDEP